MKAKKSLGQNFLKSKKVLEKIFNTSDLKKKDIILEIGPGRGFLTKKLLESGGTIVAIEKDYNLTKFLEEKFSYEIKKGRLRIYNCDALKMDYKKLGLKDRKFKVISTLPYYITGKFISNILSNSIQPKMIVLVLQKEVVERITVNRDTFMPSKKKEKESLLSLSVKVYGEPKFIMPISAKNFSPQPKVNSALLKVEKISKNFFRENKIDEDIFFKFLKASFSGKRKKILKNLKNNWEDCQEIFSFLKIDENVRAEDLKLNDFKNIFLEK